MLFIEKLRDHMITYFYSIILVHLEISLKYILKTTLLVMIISYHTTSHHRKLMAFMCKGDIEI